ncbi:beta-amylase 1 [Pyrus ussuriensis x Pyrus communis]|uniref:Beta-amylase 1 n=1 Tax=Pyrus ussuriensis x Pyrus communis TaxID=2448454 RepID=A0A5N5IQD2_9ROSA|nr:beta-amylase 1 [Pyrus ussuriensis x Pyrus communis]
MACRAFATEVESPFIEHQEKGAHNKSTRAWLSRTPSGDGCRGELGGIGGGGRFYFQCHGFSHVQYDKQKNSTLILDVEAELLKNVMVCGNALRNSSRTDAKHLKSLYSLYSSLEQLNGQHQHCLLQLLQATV